MSTARFEDHILQKHIFVLTARYAHQRDKEDAQRSEEKTVCNQEEIVRLKEGIVRKIEDLRRANENKRCRREYMESNQNAQRRQKENDQRTLEGKKLEDCRLKLEQILASAALTPLHKRWWDSGEDLFAFQIRKHHLSTDLDISRVRSCTTNPDIIPVSTLIELVSVATKCESSEIQNFRAGHAGCFLKREIGVLKEKLVHLSGLGTKLLLSCMFNSLVVHSRSCRVWEVEKAENSTAERIICI